MGRCPLTIFRSTGLFVCLNSRHSQRMSNSSVSLFTVPYLQQNRTSPTVLSCPSRESKQIRVIINDAVAPLTGIEGCPDDAHGMCPVPTFVAAQKKIIAHTDWDWACNGDWKVPAGHEWNTTTGDVPSRVL